MTHLSYIVGAWGTTVVAVGLYAWALRMRGRRVMRRVKRIQADVTSGDRR